MLPTVRAILHYPTTASYRADTNAWIAAATGSYSTADIQALDALLGGLATDSLLSKMDRIWHSGFGDNSADSLRDFIGRHVATAVNDPSFARRQGFTGNGTNSYVNTNYIPSNGANWGLDSATGLVFVRNHVYVGARRVFGVNNASNANQTTLGYEGATQNYFGRVNNAASSSSTNPQASLLAGWGGVTRTDSTRVNLLRTDSYVVGSITTTSTGVATIAMFVGAANNNGTAERWVSSQISSIAFGSGFTPADYTNWQARFATFHTAIGFS